MNRVLSNSAWLTAAHLSGFVIPILELPILTRALGPEVYGSVLFALSLALALSLVVEYGFNLSASRQVAVASGDVQKISKTVGDVFLAKGVISAAVVLVSVMVNLIWGMPGPLSRDLLVPALLFFLAFGFSPFWYFQGTEKMVGPVLLNLSLRAFAVLALWLLVREQDDAALALYILASAGLLNTVITCAWLFAEVGAPSFSLTGALTQLRQGWHTFLYRSANDVLMSASPAVLGVAANRYETGIFAPAEKLIRASAGMAMPVLTAFFPHFSRLHAGGQVSKGWPLVWGMTIIAILGAGLLVVLAPWLIMLLAGDEFGESVQLVKWFALLIPLRVFNQSLGLSLLIPAGKDRFAGYSLLVCAGMAMISGFFLASALGAVGMVCGLLLGEAVLACLLTYYATRSGMRHS